MSDVCPLCGDSMDPIPGEAHNWFRVVYRVDGGPWMAVHDGKIVIPQPPCRVTVQRPGAPRIRHVFVAEVPEVELVIVRLRCPKCGTWAELDDDQYHGRVSAQCETPGCTFHETHDFAALELAS